MKSMRDSLYEKLNRYGQSDVYPFHMPGHKRRSNLVCSPYAYDITEIDGFDNLHHARGILKESMDMATEFYGTKRTYYLVNGSTCGILSAVSACVEQQGTILMARNCHKAVYNSVYLLKLKAKYIYPGQIEGCSISGGISAEDVRDMLREYPDTRAVIITSPTYEGVVSDVEAIAEVVHEYGIPLIVDEAHGAHFSMSGYFPKSALECGADIVIQSIHKTLPAMTQTALLHVCSDRIDLCKVERFLAIYQSSSPSYVLMASIDNCIRTIIDKGMFGFLDYEERLINFRDRVKKFTHLKLMDRDIIGKAGVYDLDGGKLVINVKSNAYTGHAVYKELLDKYHLQMEMAAYDYIIAMTSVEDEQTGFDRLYDALEHIDRDIRIDEGYGRTEFKNPSQDEKEEDTFKVSKKAVVCREVYEAVDSDREQVEFLRSSGRISAEYIYLYPPGIPVIVPGELIDRTTIEYLLECKSQGLEVIGQVDDSLKSIMVIKENWKEFSYGKNILPDGQKLIGKGYHF